MASGNDRQRFNPLADSTVDNDPEYAEKFISCLINKKRRYNARKRRVPIATRINQTLNEWRTYYDEYNANVRVKPVSIVERTANGYFDNNSDDVYGDSLYADICRTMTEFGVGEKRIKLRVDQQTMFSHCMNALLPLIYRHKLEANRKRLLRNLGLKKVIQEVVILASRRVGKTWFVAILLAALMICFPEVEIACFSLAMRTSQKMMRLVVDMLSRHERGKSMIIKHNQEQLVLAGNTAYEYKILHSFPDRPDVCIIFIFLSFFFYLYHKVT